MGDLAFAAAALQLPSAGLVMHIFALPLRATIEQFTLFRCVRPLPIEQLGSACTTRLAWVFQNSVRLLPGDLFGQFTWEQFRPATACLVCNLPWAARGSLISLTVLTGREEEAMMTFRMIHVF